LLGIQQSVTDQAIDQWQVCLNACFKAKGKHCEYVLWYAVPQLLIIFFITFTLQIFGLQLLTSHDR